MTREKIEEVVALYRARLEQEGIPKERMDTSRTLGSLTSQERLAHAHFLLDGILEYCAKPGKEGKTGRHLGSIQMILTLENWYTLNDLMNHNRPNES